MELTIHLSPTSPPVAGVPPRHNTHQGVRFCCPPPPEPGRPPPQRAALPARLGKNPTAGAAPHLIRKIHPTQKIPKPRGNFPARPPGGENVFSGGSERECVYFFCFFFFFVFIPPPAPFPQQKEPAGPRPNFLARKTFQLPKPQRAPPRPPGGRFRIGRRRFLGYRTWFLFLFYFLEKTYARGNQFFSAG